MLGISHHEFTLYHLVLETNGKCRYMGRVSHVRIEPEKQPGDLYGQRALHTVVFRDTYALRTLIGKLTLDEDRSRFLLDLGADKKYHFCRFIA